MEDKASMEDGNWFRVSKDISEAMARGDFEAVEYALLWWIIWATYGQRDRIGPGEFEARSHTHYQAAQIARETGRSPKLIRRAGQALLERVVLRKDEQGRIGINPHIIEWQPGTIRGEGLNDPSSRGLNDPQGSKRPSFEGSKRPSAGAQTTLGRGLNDPSEGSKSPRSQYARAADADSRREMQKGLNDPPQDQGSKEPSAPRDPKNPYATQWSPSGRLCWPRGKDPATPQGERQLGRSINQGSLPDNVPVPPATSPYGIYGQGSRCGQYFEWHPWRGRPEPGWLHNGRPDTIMFRAELGHPDPEWHPSAHPGWRSEDNEVRREAAETWGRRNRLRLDHDQSEAASYANEGMKPPPSVPVLSEAKR